MVTINWVTIDGVPNGRGIYASSNNTIRISNSTIKNCVTTDYGGGIRINGSGNTFISYVTITACKSSGHGGGMYLDSSGNVSVSNTTIDNVSTATGLGGGIFIIRGNLSVVNSIIRNITGSGTYCTGIYHNSIGNLEVNGLELQNIPSYGIYSDGRGIMKFSGITATNINSDWGVYSIATNPHFTLSDSTFNSCGVYCSSNESVQVTDTVIRNASGANGLYCSSGSGTITIDRVIIDGVPNGRGIYANSSNSVKISNSTIKNCVTTSDGGGIFLSVSGNGWISDVNITACTAGSLGGGMSLTGSGNVFVSKTTIDSVRLTADAGFGGGIYNSGNLSIEDSVIKNITGNDRYCTGIYHNSIGNLEVSGLELQNISSGGISCSGTGTRYFSGITASDIGSTGIYYYSTSGSFTLTDSKFTSCNVICYASGSAVPIQITNTEIHNAPSNYALDCSNESGTIIIEGVIIDGVPNGRGIVAASDNTVRVSNSTIKNCRGGISIFGQGNKEIYGTTISDNNSGVSNGGGLYISGGNLTMNGNTISGNITSSEGGGVYFNGGTFTLNGGTISNNSANESGGNGGGIYIANASFIMRGGTISGNKARIYGGGVYIASFCTVSKTGGTIYGSGNGNNSNTAGTRGDAVYFSSSLYSNNTLGPSNNWP
jgi:hypothetical protein